MKNTNEVSNKEFADKYIKLQYKALEAKFRAICSHINKDSESSLDILEDTCISLYYIHTCETYDEFKRIADKKFKICSSDIKKSNCNKEHEDDE